MDAALDTSSHETFEVVTDPERKVNNAWSDSSGEEIADKCENHHENLVYGNGQPYVRDMPSILGAPGLTPLFAWPDNWEMLAAAECVKNWTGVYDDSLIVAVGPLGQILKVPDEGGKYSHLVERGCLIAWGLQRMGGMKAHPTDGRVYAVQPECGSVIAIDPSTPQNYRFEPPVVQGLNTPTCPRFSPDGETMFVCGSGNGVIWKVTNFLR